MTFARRSTLLGYSLMELLIVVVLAALILSLGIPSYRNYTMRANRADATSALMRIAAAQERYFLDEDTYTANLALLGFDPPETERGYYALDVQPAAGGIAAGFTIRATAIIGRGQEDDDQCTELNITESGQRGSQPGDPDYCWR